MKSFKAIVISAALASAAAIPIGIAVANQPPPSDVITNEQALAALTRAQNDLDYVKRYLSTPTPTPNPPTSTSNPTSVPPTSRSSPPPVPTNPIPPPSDGTTTAQKLNWGAPQNGSDEFNYTGKPKTELWWQSGECWPGHAGNGKRCSSRTTVDGSKLVQSGLSNGDSAWLASKTEKRYGRWEARVRSSSLDGLRQYHPLLIIWPTSNKWPEDGEYDFLENGNPGATCAESFMHYPHNPGPVQQEFKREPAPCGAMLSEWHNVAFDWQPTGVKGYIDGVEWFSYSGGANFTRKAIQDMPSGHLTIQLDNFFGIGMTPAKYEIDWVRLY